MTLLEHSVISRLQSTRLSRARLYDWISKLVLIHFGVYIHFRMPKILRILISFRGDGTVASFARRGAFESTLEDKLSFSRRYQSRWGFNVEIQILRLLYHHLSFLHLKRKRKFLRWSYSYMLIKIKYDIMHNWMCWLQRSSLQGENHLQYVTWHSQPWTSSETFRRSRCDLRRTGWFIFSIWLPDTDIKTNYSHDYHFNIFRITALARNQ